MLFCNSAAASAASVRLEKGMLCSWLCREEISILFDLMTAVKQLDISTENICVFNTTLCILLFKRLDNALCQVLQDIHQHESANGVPGCATGNYRALLQFWRRYYVLKGRDSSMLHFRCASCFARCALLWFFLFQTAIAAPIFPSWNGHVQLRSSFGMKHTLAL
jgi:hypothetical protein